MGIDEYSLIYRDIFMKNKFQVRDKKTHELICVCENINMAELVKHSIENCVLTRSLEIIDCTISL